MATVGSNRNGIPWLAGSRMGTVAEYEPNMRAAMNKTGRPYNDFQPLERDCENCGGFVLAGPCHPYKRFCSRRCQNTAYVQSRLVADPEFLAAYRTNQRLWNIRDRARRRLEAQHG